MIRLTWLPPNARSLCPPAKSEFGFKLVKDKAADLLYPWEQPPLKLHGKLLDENGKPEAVVLLPMGSTILRRTCFPPSQ